MGSDKIDALKAYKTSYLSKESRKKIDEFWDRYEKEKAKNKEKNE
jgi:hypothetical protein